MVRPSKWLGLILASFACASPQQRSTRTFAEVPVVGFDSLFPLAHSVQLRPSPENPMAVPASLVVAAGLVIVADPGLATVGIFSRSTGHFVRRFGRAGDGPGEYRIPGALQVDAKGQVWILDVARQTVTVRDTAGPLLAEYSVPGTWAGMALAPDFSGVVLSGRRAGLADTLYSGHEPPALHEVDSAGTHWTSYLRIPRPDDEWKSSFNNFFVTALGSVLAVGSYDTNAVRFHDRRTRRDWTATFGAPWYRAPNWPDGGKPPGGRSVLDAINTWVRAQTMVHALVTVDQESFLAVFHSSSPAGDRLYSYVLGDTAGVSRMATTASPSQVLQVVGDSAFALLVDADGEVFFETRVLRRVH